MEKKKDNNKFPIPRGKDVLTEGMIRLTSNTKLADWRPESVVINPKSQYQFQGTREPPISPVPGLQQPCFWYHWPRRGMKKKPGLICRQRPLLTTRASNLVKSLQSGSLLCSVASPTSLYFTTGHSGDIGASAVEGQEFYALRNVGLWRFFRQEFSPHCGKGWWYEQWKELIFTIYFVGCPFKLGTE